MENEQICEREEVDVVVGGVGEDCEDRGMGNSHWAVLKTNKPNKTKHNKNIKEK